MTGPVCALGPDRALRLWAPAKDLVVKAENQPLAVTKSEWIEGGTLLTVTVPPGQNDITVESPQPGVLRIAKVRLAPDSEPAWYKTAKELRDSGKIEEAQKALTPGLEGKGIDRARALGLLARIEQRKGDLPSARQKYAESIRLGKEAGWISGVVRDTEALSYSLSQMDHRYGDARKVLDELTDLLPSFPEGEATVPYFHALVEQGIGDDRHALSSMRQSRLRCARLGMTTYRQHAEAGLGTSYFRLGRIREALELWQHVGDASPCLQAVHEAGVGFLLVVLRDQQNWDGDESPTQDAPTSHLTNALNVIGQNCHDAQLLANTWSDLAWIELQAGHFEAAEQALKTARTALPDTEMPLRLWWSSLQSRIALAKGNAPLALRLAKNTEQLAQASLDQRMNWDALLNQALALEHMGNYGPAEQVLERAEDLLDDAAFDIPLGDGRGAFLKERDRSARLRIELLLRLKRPTEAMQALRRSRSRVLRSIEHAERLAKTSPEDFQQWDEAVSQYQRQRADLLKEAQGDWQLPTEKLERAQMARKEREANLRSELDLAFSQLGRSSVNERAEPLSVSANEVVIAYHRIRRGWVGIATDGAHWLAKSLSAQAPCETPSELSAWLLEPFRPMLSKAKRLRVMPYDSLRKIDFHTLPWDGAPLITRMPVSYSLDLRDSSPQPSGHRALVVADPSGELRAAGQESEQVARNLRDSGQWQVQLVAGRDASPQRVLGELAASDLLHFAGHGAFGSHEGWESALLVGPDQSSITVGDLLSTARVPARVILTACEAGRSENEGAEGLGIAQAFVVAGAGEVMAPTRLVNDELSAEVAQGVYETMTQQGWEDLAGALQRVQARLSAQHDKRDWAAYRVLTQ